jgi:polyhydroxyalkanoate synthesis regulator phasin
MDELKNLLTCGAPWAEQRATIALSIVESRQNGDISESEAKELLEDLIRTDALNEEADDINVKSALISAVSGVMSVV